MARPLATFLIALGVSAPAFLDANIEVDGKKLRPHQQHFTMDDGTRVTVDVDRALVTTGDKVVATVAAYSDTPKRVALDLRLVQTQLQPGERIEPPQHQIDREKITVQASPEGGTTKVALVLGAPRKAAGKLDRFDIYVGPHGTPSPTKHDYDGDADSGGDFWQAAIGAGKAAAVDVMGWSGDSIAMKVVPDGPIIAGKPFTIAVKVKNTTGVPLPYPARIDVTTGEGLMASARDDDDNADEPVTIEAVESDDEAIEPHLVERGVEVVRHFRVTPKSPMREITLAVSATAYDDEIGPILGGARNAITFHAVDETAKVAAK